MTLLLVVSEWKQKKRKTLSDDNIACRREAKPSFDPVCAFSDLNNLSQGSLIRTDHWDLAGFLRSMLQNFISSIAVSLTEEKVKDLISKVVWLNDTTIVGIAFSRVSLLFDIDFWFLWTNKVLIYLRVWVHLYWIVLDIIIGESLFFSKPKQSFQF